MQICLYKCELSTLARNPADPRLNPASAQIQLPLAGAQQPEPLHLFYL